MKYRRLTYQEFDLLKDDFQEYLYSQKLSSFEWRILQDQYSTNAQNILEQYSDITFEKVFRDINYLEIRTPKKLSVTHFTEEMYTTIGIEVPQISSLDLTDIECLSNLKTMDFGGYRSYKKSEFYTLGRETKVFEMLESGAYVVDSNSFDFLRLVRQSYQN